MALMVSDINGSRIVMGPVFSHYEFYKDDGVLEGQQRYTDAQWQEKYDHLSQKLREKTYGLEQRKFFEAGLQ